MGGRQSLIMTGNPKMRKDFIFTVGLQNAGEQEQR